MITSEDLKQMTPEQLKELAASMFNPVKICDAHLPSKIHNDIIRQANPSWSEQDLSTVRIHNESQYAKAIELEKKCQYQTETQFEMRGQRRYPRRYVTRCVFGLNPSNLKLASGAGGTPENSLKKAKEHAVYFIERNLLALAGEIRPEHVFWHISFIDRYFCGQQIDIHDEIDSWHKSSIDMELHEYLGLTKEQYAKWVENPLILKEFL